MNGHLIFLLKVCNLSLFFSKNDEFWILVRIALANKPLVRNAIHPFLTPFVTLILESILKKGIEVYNKVGIKSEVKGGTSSYDTWILMIMHYLLF